MFQSLKLCQKTEQCLQIQWVFHAQKVREISFLQLKDYTEETELCIYSINCFVKFSPSQSTVPVSGFELKIK